MILHIFKKDVRLLWPFAAGMALVHFALAGVAYRIDHFGVTGSLDSLLTLLEIAGILGAALLIAAVVHQDAVPGVRQDWLVRPVKRRDLLAAKLLFLLAMVQAPMVVADFCEVLAAGFGPGAALGAAAARAAYLFFLLLLPMLVFASLTRNFMETIIGGLGSFLAFAAFMLFFARSKQYDLAGSTGSAWITESGRFVIVLCGALVILLLQYLRRRTVQARWLFGAAGLAMIAIGLLPWASAFAIQQRVSTHAATANAVAIAYAPEAGPRTGSGTTGAPEIRVLDLATRFTGLPEDSVLKVDYADILLTGPDGHPQSFGFGNNPMDVTTGEKDAAGGRVVHHIVRVRGDLFDRMVDTPVRVEVDYSLTLFRLASAHAIPAVNGEQRIADAGWCRTQVNRSATSVRLKCVQAGNSFSCASVFIENPVTGLRNPAQSGCPGDYSPYQRIDFPDAIGRRQINLAVRDASGLAKYPVDSSQLRSARVVLRIYKPEDHFRRRMVIPEIRPKDLELRAAF